MSYRRFHIPVGNAATAATAAVLEPEISISAFRPTAANAATAAGPKPKSEVLQGGNVVVLAERSAAKPDVEHYADALRLIGPCGYGPVAVLLGWGATRAADAEVELRQQGRVVYDRTGRGRLAD